MESSVFFYQKPVYVTWGGGGGGTESSVNTVTEKKLLNI